MDNYYIAKILRNCEKSVSVMENRPDEEAYWYIGYLLSALEEVQRDAKMLAKMLETTTSMV
jgi:hypothetical protein